MHDAKQSVKVLLEEKLGSKINLKVGHVYQYNTGM